MSTQTPQEEKPKLKRAVSVSQLVATKFKTFKFTGDWLKLMGMPEKTGTILIWGDSGSGKTRFALQFAKYLTQFGRVAFNSIEEGVTESMRKAFIEVGLEECKNRIVLLDKEPIHDLAERLSRRKSPDIIILDSWQYMQMTYLQFKALTDTFSNKLFIVLSHAKGGLPKGSADAVRYNAFVKIRVDGFKAFAESRYGGTGDPYIIYEKGAYKFWGEKPQPKQESKTKSDGDN